MKKNWSIWSIKNRWLRAAVAWPCVVGMTIVAAVVIVCATVFFALKGAWDTVVEGYVDGFGVHDRREWAAIFGDAWAAMTAKDRQP